MKIEITEKQKKQFNEMLLALKRIKAYDYPDKIRKNCEKEYGLDYETALEYAYENIQDEAIDACKNVKFIK